MGDLIWAVAERYMARGHEAVFRQTHGPDKSIDSTIKSDDDRFTVKHIEVKGISGKAGNIANRVRKATEQLSEACTGDDVIAIYLPDFCNNESGREFAEAGIAEVQRKYFVKYPNVVWFSDKTKITFNLEGQHGQDRMQMWRNPE